MGEHIVIIGGGVIGLSCAFESLRRGFQVTLVEAGRCGGQASGAAAGMLAPFSENVEFPDDFFRLCLASLRLYPEWQQAIKDCSGADFEYTNCGSLYAAFHEADILALESRRSWHNEFGAQAEIIDARQLRELEPCLSSKAVAAYYSPVESHVHAPDYVKALEAACRKLGAHIHEHSGPVSPHIHADRVAVVGEQGQIVAGDKLIICSGAWSGQLETQLGIRIPVFPIRGQICAYDTPEPKVHHMVFGSQGYLVSKRHGQLVCGASEDLADFDTSVTEQGIARLEAWNDKVFPFIKELVPTLKWAGLRPATQDGYPLLGKLPHDERVIMACGHYRNGILLSPVTAKVTVDLLTDAAEQRLLEAFAPDRFGYV